MDVGVKAGVRVETILVGSEVEVNRRVSGLVGKPYF